MGKIEGVMIFEMKGMRLVIWLEGVVTGSEGGGDVCLRSARIS